MPNLQEIIKGGFEGIGNAAANIISKFKADPTKALEFEKEIEELRLNAGNEAARIAIEAEKVKQDELRIALEEYKTTLADKASSRDMNAKIQESDKASWLSKNVAYMLDLFVALLWGTITIILFLKVFKVVAKDVDMISLMALHGTVTAVFMVTMQFHRGSSIGSERKQRQLEKLSP